MCAWIARLILLMVLPLADWRSPGGAWGEVVSAHVPPPHSSPQFSPSQRTSLVVARGDNVTLECKVLRLHDKTVSWVRSRDLQILAADGIAFTSDARVRGGSGAGGGAGTVRHTLSITGVRPADSGRYECQVNTEPKMSLFYNLTVLDSALPVLKVWISGDRVQRYPAGSTARLHCAARYSPALPDYQGELPLEPHWYREDQPIDLQNPWGGVSLDASHWSGGARSTLALGALTPAHAGTYSCTTNDMRDSVVLLVTDDLAVNDPQMDAMQRDQSLTSRTNKAQQTSPHGIYLLSLVVILCCCSLLQDTTR